MASQTLKGLRRLLAAQKCIDFYAALRSVLLPKEPTDDFSGVDFYAPLGGGSACFYYRKPGAARYEQRYVQPYHLGCVENLWYLFAFDMDRGELRTFALPRIRDVRVSKTRFKRPIDFSIGRFLEQSFGVTPSQQKPSTRFALHSTHSPLRWYKNGNGIHPKRLRSCETAALSFV